MLATENGERACEAEGPSEEHPGILTCLRDTLCQGSRASPLWNWGKKDRLPRLRPAAPLGTRAADKGCALQARAPHACARARQSPWRRRQHRSHFPHLPGAHCAVGLAHLQAGQTQVTRARRGPRPRFGCPSPPGSGLPASTRSAAHARAQSAPWRQRVLTGPAC